MLAPMLTATIDFHMAHPATRAASLRARVGPIKYVRCIAFGRAPARAGAAGVTRLTACIAPRLHPRLSLRGARRKNDGLYRPAAGCGGHRRGARARAPAPAARSTERDTAAPLRRCKCDAGPRGTGEA